MSPKASFLRRLSTLLLLSLSYYTESSTVTKSYVNPDVEVSSETSLSQNTHKEGMSRGSRDTHLASDAEAKNTAIGKTSEHPSGFSASNAAREKLSRK